MSAIRVFLTTTVLGLAISLLVGLIGVFIGGLFLFAMIPLYGRGGLAAIAGSLLGFGLGWTALVSMQIGRAGTNGSGPVWLAVGVVPLVIGLVIGIALGVSSRPSGSDGRGGDTLP